MQRTPSYPKTLKHNPTAAPDITSHALMPTDASTANIHVWMGPAQTWMKGTDRDFAASVGLHSTVSKIAEYLLLNKTVFDTGVCWTSQNLDII